MKKLPSFKTQATWHHYAVALVIFVVGLVGGWVVHAEMNDVSPARVEVRGKTVAGQFTNPLLECSELSESLSIGERKALRSTIASLIDERKESGTITDASIYFRDLNNGPWFGINESEKFYPASLLKVPLAMWYYWKADSDPSILDQAIEFTGPRGISLVQYPPQVQLEEGKTYTIEALLQYMLQESDNDAAAILAQYAGSDQTVEVYKDLGVDPKQQSVEQPINVHTYASFFRILYNATYLRRSLSEHMLSIMSHSSFVDGIVAGVPQGVVVSHKFGEKVVDEGLKLYQLHDCGIVYAGENPYILCVMTQGHDYGQLASFMRDVSQAVYQSVVRGKK